MVKITFVKRFLKKISKIKDKSFREQVDKRIKELEDRKESEIRVLEKEIDN